MPLPKEVKESLRLFRKAVDSSALTDSEKVYVHRRFNKTEAEWDLPDEETEEVSDEDGDKIERLTRRAVDTSSLTDSEKLFLYKEMNEEEEAEAEAEAEEREVFRTRIHGFVDKIDGTCIVTNLRVIVRWDYGEVAQYPFGQIRSVRASNDVRHVYFQKRPGVVIELINGRHLTYETPEAGKLGSSIQNVMIPF